MNDTEYVPLMQAARYLGVSRVKLNQLIKEGAIAYTVSAIDRRFKLIKKSDLDAFLAKHPRPHSHTDT